MKVIIASYSQSRRYHLTEGGCRDNYERDSFVELDEEMAKSLGFNLCGNCQRVLEPSKREEAVIKSLVSTVDKMSTSDWDELDKVLDAVHNFQQSLWDRGFKIARKSSTDMMYSNYRDR